MEHSFSQEWESFREPPETSPDQSKPVEAQEQQFRLNDIVIPDDEMARAKEQLKRIGITFSEQALSEREILNPEGTMWRPGEFVLSLKDAATDKPLERDIVLQAIELLRTSAEPITIRLAVI